MPNKEAIRKCVKLGLALGCKINQYSKFDRKNYFYPDLPKGYQISQFDLPFCEKGHLEVDVAGDSRRIRITRIHMEEDTGKSIHEGTATYLDFNKSGVPLIEIVTEPDFSEVEEVNAFAKRLKQVIRYLDISDADMEKGQMRFELNMSLKPAGTKGLPNYKVEIKNIGSISVLEKVIASEFIRQSALLDEGKVPAQETRGLKDMSGTTVSQRVKENSDDYRYFPEPDIPPVVTTAEMIEALKAEISELPHEKKQRYLADYKLEPATAETIVMSRAKAEWFEKAVKDIKDLKVIQEIAKWYIGDLSALMKTNKLKLKDLKLKPENFAKLLVMLNDRKLSGTLAKQVLAEIYKEDQDPELYASEHGMMVMNDTEALKKIAAEVVAANPKVVADISKNPNAVKFLVGQVMRATKGKADPKIAEALLQEILL